MPRRKTHVRVGVTVGAVAAGYRSRNEPGMLLEALGGAVGGYLGALCPDYIEPAVGGRHRQLFHSWTTLVSGLAATKATLIAWELFCRANAATAQQDKLKAQSEGRSSFFHVIEETIWRIAAGVLAGFIAGYASHLILDSQTPHSLPVC